MKDNKKSRSSRNMSIRQQERNAVIAFPSDEPKCFADLAPRGPLAVKNRVVGVLIENGDDLDAITVTQQGPA